MRVWVRVRQSSVVHFAYGHAASAAQAPRVGASAQRHGVRVSAKLVVRRALRHLLQRLPRLCAHPRPPRLHRALPVRDQARQLDVRQRARARRRVRHRGEVLEHEHVVVAVIGALARRLRGPAPVAVVEIPRAPADPVRLAAGAFAARFAASCPLRVSFSENSRSCTETFARKSDFSPALRKRSGDFFVCSSLSNCNEKTPNCARMMDV